MEGAAVIDVPFETVTTCHWCRSTELTELATRADGIPVLRCARCHLAMTGALPEDLGVFYDADYYSRSVHEDMPTTGYVDYERAFSPLSFRWLTALLRASTRPDQRQLFDIGAATGSFLEMAAHDGFVVAGSELNSQGAAEARSKGLDVRSGLFDPSHWEPASFGVVTALEVLEHITDVRAFLEQLEIILKPDGLFCYFVPNLPDHLIDRYGSNALDFNKTLEHTLYFNERVLEEIISTSFPDATHTLWTKDVEQHGQTVSFALGVVRLGGGHTVERDVLRYGLSDATDGLPLDYDGLVAAALCAAKFFRFPAAHDALAAARKDRPGSLAAVEAQLLRNEGRLLDAIDVLTEAISEKRIAHDPVIAALLVEVLQDFLVLVGATGSDLGAMFRDLHVMITRLSG